MPVNPANTLDIGEWLPDLPPLRNPGALQAFNVIPELNSYRSIDSPQAFTTALASPARGAIWGPDGAGSVFNFAGDAANLYRLDGGVNWTNVNRTTGNPGYANSPNTFWSFAQFGRRVIAVTAADNPQYFDVGTSSNFADLADVGDEPPRARHVAVIRDFVFMGNTATEGSAPAGLFGEDFIAWSGFNASQIWTPSQSTQSDTQQLLGRGGAIQAIVGGNYGLIFQQNSIWRADYVGPPIIFNLDEFQTGHGAIAPRSVVRDRDLTYYYSLDGFYRTNGASVEPIGNNRVNRWFEQNASVQALDSMQGVVDRRRRLIIWAFRTTTGATSNNRIIIYNWAADKWAYGAIDSQIISGYSPQGLNLDQLDTPLPDGIDIDSIGVDSDAFKRNVVSVALFDADNRMAVLAGPALRAEVDTVERLAPAGQTETTLSVRPLLEALSDANVRVAILEKRDERSSRLTATPFQNLNDIGEADIRTTSRRKRFRIEVNGRFDSLTGLEYRSSTPAGRR